MPATRQSSRQVTKAPARQPRRARAVHTRNPSYRASTVYSNTVTNSGSIATFPTISKESVTGPTSVYLENATAGKTVWVNVPAGSGTLSVDFSTRTVTFAGATVTNAVTEDSRWWTLAPGANTVRSNVAASVSHRNAYTN